MSTYSRAGFRLAMLGLVVGSLVGVAGIVNAETPTEPVENKKNPSGAIGFVSPESAKITAEEETKRLAQTQKTQHTAERDKTCLALIAEMSKTVGAAKTACASAIGDYGEIKECADKIRACDSNNEEKSE